MRKSGAYMAQVIQEIDQDGAITFTVDKYV